MILIAERSHMVDLLQKCTEHNIQISISPITYTRCGHSLPWETAFAYFGLQAITTMNVLTSFDVKPSSFCKLLSSRFYAYIVRHQLEYGLVVNRFTRSQLYALKEAHDPCIKRIYGARGNASTKVMLHMSKLPLITTREHQWHTLSCTSLWRMVSSINNDLGIRLLKATKRRFL
ncbi:hypothetical protein BCV72DRAFT_251921 [Rhizopus microsporus var. microsporus]|uniref:Uncharacterized protein n=1 Tax=Rhizopus microsporus var. microsporus TaxID=86635 RepID=A0A1X0QUE3_RHIZD|nr:hypothetical protein BCV72DRAFT_251921 [Rhizopus microsporus var. microsporus]